MGLIYFFLAISLWLLSAFSGPTCYHPDKTIASGDIHCTNDPFSSCCSPDSYCLQNGLCWTNLTLSRGSCTDQTWTSPNCAQYCQNFAPSKYTIISPCLPEPNSLFSCGFKLCSSSNFSISGHNVSIVLRDYQAAGLGFLASTDAPTITATATSLSTKRTSSAETASPTPQCSPDKGNVTAVGAGIGVSFGVALIAALVLFGSEKRKHHRLREEHSRAVAQQQALHNRLEWYEKQIIAPWRAGPAVSHETVYQELPTPTQTHELPGGTPPKVTSDD